MSTKPDQGQKKKRGAYVISKSARGKVVEALVVEAAGRAVAVVLAAAESVAGSLCF